MKNKEFNLLIIGYFESVFIIQFVKNLKKQNANAHIYYWGHKPSKDITDEEYLKCYDEYCLYDFNHRTSIPIIRKVDSLIQFKKSFNAFVADKHFDFVNIHFIRPEYFFILGSIKQHSSKLVLTPWGSDVYRVSKLQGVLVRRVYNKADYITGTNNRFTSDVKRIFRIPSQKLINCELGVESLDYIVDHKVFINTLEAKRQLGVEGSYVITCGYNAIKAQRHLEIINSLYSIKEQLPSNLILFFPFTYPQNSEYKKIVKQQVEERGFKAVYFEDFLDVPHLYLLRMAADMFIHVQTTDAYSASFMEYLLCEKKIINGLWLKYPQLEIDGQVPYFEVESMEKLGECILETYKSKPIAINTKIIKEIESKQWKVVINNWDHLFSELTVQPVII